MAAVYPHGLFVRPITRSEDDQLRKTVINWEYRSECIEYALHTRGEGPGGTLDDATKLAKLIDGVLVNPSHEEKVWACMDTLGRVHGIACFIIQGKHLELKNLLTSPDRIECEVSEPLPSRFKGAAKILMHSIADHTLSNGLEEIILDQTESAETFYEALGFDNYIDKGYSKMFLDRKGCEALIKNPLPNRIDPLPVAIASPQGIFVRQIKDGEYDKIKPLLSEWLEECGGLRHAHRRHAEKLPLLERAHQALRKAREELNDDTVHIAQDPSGAVHSLIMTTDESVKKTRITHVIANPTSLVDDTFESGTTHIIHTLSMDLLTRHGTGATLALEPAEDGATELLGKDEMDSLLSFPPPTAISHAPLPIPLKPKMTASKRKGELSSSAAKRAR